MIEAGLVGTCGIIELEVRYSARSHPEYEEIRRDRGLGYESFPMPDELWGRALEVQRALSGSGQLRAVKFPDLLIAATAERHGLVVVHYDSDYDLIAAVTDQPTEWVVPQGSVR
jgi:predicted nucleic acid-binding protein